MIGNVSREEEIVLLQKAVNNLLNDTRLNAWEREFMASINARIPAGGLSEKQLRVLNRIRNKYRA